jgi:hypothetical protein
LPAPALCLDCQGRLAVAGEPVVPPQARRDDLFVVDFDEPTDAQPVERGVQRTGPQSDAAVGEPLEVLDQPVPVLRALGERGEDQERRFPDRERTLSVVALPGPRAR